MMDLCSGINDQFRSGPDHRLSVMEVNAQRRDHLIVEAFHFVCRDGSLVKALKFGLLNDIYKSIESCLVNVVTRSRYFWIYSLNSLIEEFRG